MSFETFRDGQGIAHLRADSVNELAYAQGAAAAHDRAWQIELERCRAEGRTAAILGPAGLSWDVFARRALVDETARKCFERLDDETKAFCTAYVEGVESGLAKGAARDRHMDADSEGAAAYASWRSALVRIVAAQPVFASLREPSPYPALFDPWLGLTGRVAQALDGFLAAGSPFGIDLPALAAEALDASAAAGPAATWGAIHVFTPLHGFEQFGLDLAAPAVDAVALSGDSECVLSTRTIPGITDNCFRGPVARYVWDLSDRDASGWIVPLGASGIPGDPHHADQLTQWAAGELVPVTTHWQLLTKEKS